MKGQVCYDLSQMVDDKLRRQSERYLIVVELAVYSVLGLLLSATLALAIAGAGKLLWDGACNWAVATGTFQVLDQLLLLLMLVEILHTVRISIQSHVLVTEPFLVVGLIASIRRVLVITLEAADLMKPEEWNADTASAFHASMLELGLLGALILILVLCIVLLRRGNPTRPELTQ